mmetsp:Transcript_34336/g.96782  ORF Transcript_34336/g.96782 Transcript_34336/m.96782 type:complete len:384 (+) Transcript_34336:184-1335(+)
MAHTPEEMEPVRVMRESDFPPMKNDLYLRVALGLEKNPPHAPVWVMRQAGMYLPEYKAVRSENDFFTVCRSPELAAKVTLQPIDRYSLDASIIFSDILVVPQALGMTCEFIEGRGPVFPEPIVTPEDLAKLKRPDVRKELGYMLNGITLTRTKLDGRVPLIGFAGSPWTLMNYMIEGGPSREFALSKGFLYTHPDASHKLLALLTDTIVDFLVAQVEAGAQALMLFDSHAGQLSPAHFREFSLPYMRQIASRVKAAVEERNLNADRLGTPMGVFPKGAHYAVEDLCDSEFDIIGLDWTMERGKIVNLVSGRKVLQGNLDPSTLYAPESVIRAEVRRMFEEFDGHPLVANLGYGAQKKHDPIRMGNFIDAVHLESASVYSQRKL